MKKELKLIMICLYGIFSMLVAMVVIVGLCGVPECDSLFKMAVVKLGCVALAVVSVLAWSRITDWLKSNNIISDDDDE